MSEAALLTIAEVADRLSVSTKTVQRELRAHHLRHVKIGRATRISVRELEAYNDNLEGRKRRRVA